MVQEKECSVQVDGAWILIEGEKNLLELIRKAGTELPTFCYHSDISVYGACRMCMVDVAGRGILPACSTKPEPGMVISTNTRQIREMRKMIIELMLASHDRDCTTCPKSGTCRLQMIAAQLGVKRVRFQNVHEKEALDLSSESIVRDPGKCILCGDCVRVCHEIQSVGALDFAYRGAKARVVTGLNETTGDSECVNCGQCVKVCPVGALTVKTQISAVWNEIYNPKKTVVVQIAPAVRVALGEVFGEKPGSISTGKMVAALRRMGFDKVYDTGFGADFTVVEEGKEFLARKSSSTAPLPLFTSCCPAWVKFAEQFYPELKDNLSTCKSPQQMFGALCKDLLPKELNISREELVVVSIMPCSAKKYEATRPEFRHEGSPDVDFVLTTQELGQMIQESGIEYDQLEQGSFDMPFGFYTGAAVIFGASGGVSEAVLRFAASELESSKDPTREFKQFRGDDGVKVREIEVGGKELKLAVVSGLSNARKLIEKIRSGEETYDLVEVMACCGGCVNGGGQPLHSDKKTIAARSQGLYDSDRNMQFHISAENPYLQELYQKQLNEHKAHELLHTNYENRNRSLWDDFVISGATAEKQLSLAICFGASCTQRGAQELYAQIQNYLREHNLGAHTEIKAIFCEKTCEQGPVLEVNGLAIHHCSYARAVEEIEKALGATI